MAIHSNNQQSELEISTIRLEELSWADRLCDFASIITFCILIITLILKLTEIVPFSPYGLILLGIFTTILGFLSLILDKLRRDELEKNEELSGVTL
jgi:hypothetical protein